MPRGNGTGPNGQGAGTGRGSGGAGRGRMGGNRPGSGPSGNCICPSCFKILPYDIMDMLQGCYINLKLTF